MASMAFTLVGAFKGLSLSSPCPSSSSSFLRGDRVALSVVGMGVPLPARRLTIQMAHKKGAGSTKNGRDSKGQRLGVKIFGDQVAKPGAIIIRQRGTRVYPGNNVGMGKDHTLFSLIVGLVKFEKYGPDKKKVKGNSNCIYARFWGMPFRDKRTGPEHFPGCWPGTVTGRLPVFPASNPDEIR